MQLMAYQHDHTTEEERRELIAKAQAGDKEAEELMVTYHLSLVKKIAYSVHKKWPRIAVEDLFQMGLIGLVQAIRRFDLDSGNRFMTYAIPWISGNMRRQLNEIDLPVKVPKKVYFTYRRLQGKQLQDGTPEEVSNKLEVDLNLAERALQLSKTSFCSLESSVNSEYEQEGDNPLSLVDSIYKEDGRDLINSIAFEDMLDNILDDREREVINLRYKQDLPQKETGVKVGLSQTHVSRIEKKALNKLREALL